MFSIVLASSEVFNLKLLAQGCCNTAPRSSSFQIGDKFEADQKTLQELLWKLMNDIHFKLSRKRIYSHNKYGWSLSQSIEKYKYNLMASLLILTIIAGLYIYEWVPESL